MSLFIGTEIDFNGVHADFLKDSIVAKELFEYTSLKLNEQFNDSKKNYYFLTPVLKGFLENIIKNDLPLQAVSKIEPQWLINNDNSKDVQSIFFKIFFPEENVLKEHTKQINEAKEIVNSIFIHINTWIFEQSYDPIEFLKQEFIQSYSLKKNKKNGI